MNTNEEPTRPPRLIDAADAARVLRTTAKRILALAKEGLIAHYVVDGEIMFTGADVAEYLQRCRQESPASGVSGLVRSLDADEIRAAIDKADEQAKLLRRLLRLTMRLKAQSCAATSFPAQAEAARAAD